MVKTKEAMIEEAVATLPDSPTSDDLRRMLDGFYDAVAFNLNKVLKDQRNRRGW